VTSPSPNMQTAYDCWHTTAFDYWGLFTQSSNLQASDA